MNTIILNIEIEDDKKIIIKEENNTQNNTQSTNNLDSLFGSDGWLNYLYDIKDVNSSFLSGFIIASNFIDSYYTLIYEKLKYSKTLEGVQYYKQRPIVFFKSKYLKDINKLYKFKKKMIIDTIYSFLFVENINNINELFNSLVLVEKSACLSVKNISIYELTIFIKSTCDIFENIYLFKPIWEQGQLYIILRNRIDPKYIKNKLLDIKNKLLDIDISQEEENYIRNKIYLATCYDIANKLLDIFAEFHSKKNTPS
jgi:hypothetical protein